jgi:hypothetical protein
MRNDTPPVAPRPPVEILLSGSSNGRHPGSCRYAGDCGISAGAEPSRSRKGSLCGPTRDKDARARLHCRILPGRVGRPGPGAAGGSHPAPSVVPRQPVAGPGFPVTGCWILLRGPLSELLRRQESLDLRQLLTEAWRSWGALETEWIPARRATVPARGDSSTRARRHAGIRCLCLIRGRAPRRGTRSRGVYTR